MPNPGKGFDHSARCEYCGNLNWTVERYGRITHKKACPNRRDPWSQTNPHAEDNGAPVVVWIPVAYDYSDAEVLGVFWSRESAEATTANHRLEARKIWQAASSTLGGEYVPYGYNIASYEVEA